MRTESNPRTPNIPRGRSRSRRWAASFLCVAAAFGAVRANAEAKEPRGAVVTVKITALRNTKGRVLVSLFNSAKGFPDDAPKAFRRAVLPAGKKPPVVEFAGLPRGVYALAVLHDEDMNGKLTTSFWGYPKEGIGASNNKLPKKGKPRFKDALFVALEEPVERIVRIKYY